MKIIIPVAGAGNRLKPHTNTQPKPLLTVGGRPMLDYILDPLIKMNPDEVIFIIGHLGAQIKDYVRSQYEFNSTFVVQDKLLGLGYAVHLGLNEIDKSDKSPILIILGDTIAVCDFQKLTKAGKNVLGVKSVSTKEARRLGIAEVEGSIAINLEEKPQIPKSNLALIGLYYFTEIDSLRNNLAATVTNHDPDTGEIQLTKALNSMIKSGTVINTFEVDHWYDCGTKESLLDSNRHLLKSYDTNSIIAGSKIIHPVYIDKSAKINNSVIGPNVSIAANCEISNSVISDSIVNENTTISDIVLKESLMGPNDSIKGSRKINNEDASELDEQ